MQLPRVTIKTPTGVSFAIPDLLLVQAWAEFHELAVTIELDAVADGDEYEEIIGLSHTHSTFRRWMIWRSCDGIVVQPMMGRPMLFDCMADALEVLIPAQN